MSLASLRDRSLTLRHSGTNRIGGDLARALDSTRMAEDLKMDLDPWQRRFLASEHKRTLINCHRQSGKSTVAAIKAVHRAVYRVALVLIFSPSLRQSGEVLQKCVTVYHDLGKPVIATAENQLSLLLENGSRIISLPGSAATVRGFSGVDLIIIDEASLVSDELPAAVRPMLAVSGGELYALSTPHGKRGWWWDAWENGGESWERLEAKAAKIANGRIGSLNPRISTEFLQDEWVALGERVFRQEYMCEFIEVVDQAFSAEQVRGAFDRTLEPLRFEDLPEA